MTDLTGLSDDDVRVLKQAINDQLNKRVNQLGPEESEFANIPPRTYVVRHKTASAEIPALSGNTPGTATCKVYFLSPAGDYEEIIFPDASSHEIEVQNLKTDPLPYEYYVAELTAFGKWTIFCA